MFVIDIFPGILREAAGVKAAGFHPDAYVAVVEDFQKELMQYLAGQRFATHGLKITNLFQYFWENLHEAHIC